MSMSIIQTLAAIDGRWPVENSGDGFFSPHQGHQGISEVTLESFIIDYWIVGYRL